MSSICGIYSPRHPSPGLRADLEAMLAALKRRPEHQVHRFVDEAAGIAIGLVYSAAFSPPGAPPTWCQDGPRVVALDGHLGESQPSSQDAPAAKLARRLWEQGDDFSPGADGAFGLAAWDGEKLVLRLAVDAIGTRLLYLLEDGRGAFVFASELKAIYACPGVQPAVDAAALALVLSRGAIPPPFAIQQGVTKLVPAELVRIDSDGEVRRRRYWRLPAAEKRPGSLEERAEQLRQQLPLSLKRITSGVERVGVYLSGPDSALLIPGLQDAGIECRAFTLGFSDDRSMADVDWSREAARQLGVEHEAVIVDGADVTPQLAMSLLRHFDEPADTSRAVSQYFLARAAAAAGYDSCLTGGESEDLFGGIGAWETTLKLRSVGQFESDAELEERFFRGSHYFDLSRLERLLPAAADPRDALQRCFESLLEIVPRDNLFDLVQADRFLTAANGRSSLVNVMISPVLGVDVRPGFRERGLFEFARSVPNEWRGSLAAEDRRLLLLAAYGDRVPLVRLPRPKLGYPGVPWHAPGFEAFAGLVLSGLEALKQGGRVRPAGVERLLRRWRERGMYSSLYVRIWLLFALQTWFDCYVHQADPLERLSG